MCRGATAEVMLGVVMGKKIADFLLCAQGPNTHHDKWTLWVWACSRQQVGPHPHRFGDRFVLAVWSPRFGGVKVGPISRFDNLHRDRKRVELGIWGLALFHTSSTLAL